MDIHAAEERLCDMQVILIFGRNDKQEETLVAIPNSDYVKSNPISIKAVLLIEEAVKSIISKATIRLPNTQRGIRIEKE